MLPVKMPFLQHLFLITFLIGANPALGRLLVDHDGDFNDSDLTVAEALRARGYLAKEYRFKTQDGYVLTVVRGKNPLFEHESKDPILFVHGASVSPAVWLVNSAGVEPADFTLHEACSDARELYESVGEDKSANSLAFLALNFGHEVWVLSRRGYQKSEHREGHLNRTVEQAMAAVPETLMNSIFANATRTLAEAITTNENGLGVFARPLVDFLKNVKIPHGKSLSNIAEEQPEAFLHSFDPEYWHFTMDQQASFDLPQAIQFVLSKSEREKVVLVAHSTGGAIALMALSDSPEFYDRTGR